MKKKNNRRENKSKKSKKSKNKTLFYYQGKDSNGSYVEGQFYCPDKQTLIMFLQKKGIEYSLIEVKQTRQQQLLIAAVGSIFIAVLVIILSDTAPQQAQSAKVSTTDIDTPITEKDTSVDTEEYEEDFAFDEEKYPASAKKAVSLLSEKDMTSLERQAAVGNVQAQLKLAAYYQEGIFYPKDLEKMEYWLLQAAKSGNNRARLKLATWYQNKGNKEEMLYWLELAAKNYDTEARWRLGTYYAKSTKPEEKDYAEFLLKQAANNGDKSAKLMLSKFLWEKKFNQEQDKVIFDTMEAFRQKGGSDEDVPALQKEIEQKVQEHAKNKIPQVDKK